MSGSKTTCCLTGRAHRSYFLWSSAIKETHHHSCGKSQSVCQIRNTIWDFERGAKHTCARKLYSSELQNVKIEKEKRTDAYERLACMAGMLRSRSGMERWRLFLYLYDNWSHHRQRSRTGNVLTLRTQAVQPWLRNLQDTVTEHVKSLFEFILYAVLGWSLKIAWGLILATCHDSEMQLAWSQVSRLESYRVVGLIFFILHANTYGISFAVSDLCWILSQSWFRHGVQPAPTWLTLKE